MTAGDSRGPRRLTPRSGSTRLDTGGMLMRTLFLNPPSYDDFDGGAGSRYQATREVWSFWYPTWLCYPAGMIPGSRVLDAPPLALSVADTVAIAREYELVVLHTS